MKFIYFLGSFILFIGLFWMFLPHVAHHSANADSEATHFENLIYGLIGTLTGLALMTVSNKFEEKKKSIRNKKYLYELIGILFISAAFIHFALIEEHFREWWGYGLFFIIAGLAQLIYGLIIIKFKEKKYSKSRELFYFIGIIGNILIIIFYLITRIVGIPFFGPDAGSIEAVGVIDIFSKFIEILGIIFLVFLVKRENNS